MHGSKRYTAKKSGSQSGGSGKTAQQKPKDSKQLRDDLFENDGKPNKPLANMSIDKSGESGIIDVKKIKVEDFTEEQNNKLHEAHKNLLEQLKDKVFGTEISAVYDLDMEHIIIDDVGYFVGKAGEGNAPFVDPGIPFISVHNHPSNSHLGIEDLMLFGECDNCIAISSVGNTGKPVHLILKTDEFDCKGFYSCIVDRCENLRIYDNRSFKELTVVMCQIFQR